MNVLWLVRLTGHLAVEHRLIVLVNGTILMAVQFQYWMQEHLSIVTELIKGWCDYIEDHHMMLQIPLVYSAVSYQMLAIQTIHSVLDCCQNTAYTSEVSLISELMKLWLKLY